MSGGSYDYAYSRIDELADSIQPHSPLRKAFATHLHKVANACHDIEWVDSCDMARGDEDAAILACLGENAHALVLAEAIKDAETAAAILNTALQSAKEAQNGATHV